MTPAIGRSADDCRHSRKTPSAGRPKTQQQRERISQLPHPRAHDRRGARFAARTDPQTQGFGARLVKPRTAAGYTQQQLADEIGASRRQVAYYEGETEHPPAGLLIALARALNVTTDELLGIGTSRKTPNVSTRLERRLRLIERMPPKPKQQLIGLIDTFLAAEQNRKAG